MATLRAKADEEKLDPLKKTEMARCSHRPSQPGEAGFSVAEAGQRNVHALHDRQVEAAQLAVVVALVGVVQNAAGFQRAGYAPGGEAGEFDVVVFTAGPHVGNE